MIGLSDQISRGALFNSSGEIVRQSVEKMFRGNGSMRSLILASSHTQIDACCRRSSHSRYRHTDPADPYFQPERKSEELDNLRVTHGRLPVIL